MSLGGRDLRDRSGGLSWLNPILYVAEWPVAGNRYCASKVPKAADPRASTVGDTAAGRRSARCRSQARTVPDRCLRLLPAARPGNDPVAARQ